MLLDTDPQLCFLLDSDDYYRFGSQIWHKKTQHGSRDRHSAIHTVYLCRCCQTGAVGQTCLLRKWLGLNWKSWYQLIMIDPIDVLQREKYHVHLAGNCFLSFVHRFSFDKCQCLFKGCLKIVHDVTSWWPSTLTEIKFGVDMEFITLKNVPGVTDQVALR